jgi:hypothetical protein
LHRRCAEVGPDPAVNQSTILRVDGGRDGHHGSNKCETRSAHARVHQRDSIANASRWSGFQSPERNWRPKSGGTQKPRARLAGQARGPNGRLAAKKGPLVSANGELSPLSRTQRAIGQKRTPPKAAGLSYALWAETRQAHFSTRSVSPRRFNRGPPQAYPSPHALAAKGSERSQRRISPRGHRPESETTRPLKTDEQASGSVGRITPGMAVQELPPGMAVQELPKESLQPFPQHRELPHHRQYLTAFSTVSAESRHRSNVSNAQKADVPWPCGF